MKKMDNVVLKTSVDDLYELVRSKKKISVEDAAKELKLPANIVQSLVDFLVEEKIFGIEYKFTTPYIYISREIENKINFNPPDSLEKFMTKEQFMEQSTKWQISDEKISELWNKYLDENITLIREVFYTKAGERNLSKEYTDKLWEKYLVHIR